MSGNIRFDTSGFNIGRLIPAVEEAMPRAVILAAEHIRGTADEMTPVETGRLVGSGEPTADEPANVEHTSSGVRVGILYAGPYARYQHYTLKLHHEHGEPLWLEKAMHNEKDAALSLAAKTIKEAL